MNLNVNYIDAGEKIAEVLEEMIIVNAQEAAELLMNCHYAGTGKIIIRERNLLPAFFDLKTGIAGDILQKFSTYDGYLAIIGDFSKFNSKSLKDFISESNRMGRINFVTSRDEAIAVLSKR